MKISHMWTRFCAYLHLMPVRLFPQFGMGTANEDLQELHRRPANCEMRGLVLCAHREVNGAMISEIPVDLNMRMSERVALSR